MKNTVLILVLAMTAACDLHLTDWSDVPTAKIRPELDDVYLTSTNSHNVAVWQATVEAAAETWNVAVAEYGCPALFVVSTDADAHAIRLYTRATWPHDAGYNGLLSGDGPVGGSGWIHIRESRPERDNVATLIHELGHAAGLEHDETEGSIMNAISPDLAAPAERDVLKLVDHLGCR